MTNAEKESIELTKKIADLEAEVFRLKIQNDVALQNEKVKAEKAIKLQKVQLEETRAELSKKNTQIIKMSEIVQDLRNERLISDENAKFLNVNRKSFQFLIKMKLKLIQLICLSIFRLFVISLSGI